MIGYCSLNLKKEIAEFKRQKEEEVTRLEEYKKEEIRKLKYIYK